jgi:apolipoprotein N-acyltransferase
VLGCEKADVSSALRDSLLQIARLRAVEFRHPIVRNVTGGHAGVISSTGQVLHKIDIEQASQPIRLENVPVDGGHSLYAVTGSWPLIGGFTIYGALLALRCNLVSLRIVPHVMRSYLRSSVTMTSLK